MGVHRRSDLNRLLEDIVAGTRRQVYLCFGERYLCQQTVQQLEQALVAGTSGTVHAIDGTRLDTAALLSKLLSFSLLPGTQVFRVTDTRLFHSKAVGATIWDKALKAHQSGKREAAVRHLANLLGLSGLDPQDAPQFSAIPADQWQKLFGFARPDHDLSWADTLMKEHDVPTRSAGDDGDTLLRAIERGFPSGNILVLATEDVDKRKRPYLAIKEHGEIIDCSVAEGSSRAALSQQKDVVRELVQRTLAEYGKDIEPAALELLFERIGFHPVAAVMEVEKLALFCADRPRIGVDDLNLLVGRTREDAIFELTEACTSRDRARTLVTLHHLLSDGVHELAVVGALRNHLRKMLVFKTLQLLPDPAWHRSLNAGEFQNRYLPALKETGSWTDLLKGHPYALYMSFTRAAGYSVAALKRSLALLLDAEYRLKSSPLPPRLVLEELLLSLIAAGQVPAGGERRGI